MQRDKLTLINCNMRQHENEDDRSDHILNLFVNAILIAGIILIAGMIYWIYLTINLE